MSYTVPIYSKNPTEGIITYSMNKSSLDTVAGFFSFVFYIPYNESTVYSQKSSSLYISGLSYYKDLVEKEGKQNEKGNTVKNNFYGWKILLYTDEYTYKKMREEQDIYKPFLESENVIFAVVKWPRYTLDEDKQNMNGGTLRAFRSRAPFDFPDKYIFMRDADTLFETTLKNLQFPGRFKSSEAYNFTKAYFADALYDWENTFYGHIGSIEKKVPNPLIIGVGKIGFGTPYLKNWHGNELKGKRAPFGIFAGFISATPGIPVYQSMDAWDTFIEYVIERSIPKDKSEFENFFQVSTNQINATKKYYLNSINKNNTLSNQQKKNKKERMQKDMNDMLQKKYKTFSNKGSIYSIGRDEQLYLFIVLPKAIKNLYFYDIQLDDFTLPTLEKTNTANTHESYKEKYEEALARNFQKPQKKKDVKYLKRENFNNNGTYIEEGGGKRKLKRKTMRLKIEKRKTRKRRY